MRLTAFLSARFAEEERVWAERLRTELAGHAWVVERELAHCAARREVFEDCRSTLARRPLSPEVQGFIYGLLVLMAAPYSAHPDWHEAWEF